MSLIDDLRGLDLSAIVGARGSISDAVNGDGVRSLVGGGAVQTALGGFASSIGSLDALLPNAEALLQPILAGVTALGGSLSSEGLPVARFVEDVHAGAEMIATLAQGLEGDPMAFVRLTGRSADEIFQSAQGAIGHFNERLGGSLETIQRWSSGFEQAPTDPEALAVLAIDVLSPIPRGALVEVRAAVDGVLSAAGAIHLPTDATEGLVTALDAVTAAAVAGDRAALSRAIVALDRTREHALDMIQQALVRVGQEIGRLHLERALAPLAAVQGAFASGEESVLRTLSSLRAQIALLRSSIAALGPEHLTEVLERLLGGLEDGAHRHLVLPIQKQVEGLSRLVRDLFARMGIGAFRAEITRFLHGIAEAIRSAGLERGANEVRHVLEQVRATLNPDALRAQVQRVLVDVERVLDQTLGTVIGALETVGNEVRAVAAQAQGILERAAAALTGFRAAMDAVTQAIETLGIEEAGSQIVDTLQTLRQTAERVLSQVPLPEPVRPVVEQLSSTLEGIDFEAVFGPARTAVAGLRVPDEVLATVQEALRQVRDALDNLIPAQLIASIEEQVDAVLDLVRNFDPAPLLSGVTSFLRDAAARIEALDPTAAVAAIREPYQQVLTAVDAINPFSLLQPAIVAYDGLLGRISLPGPGVAAQQVERMIGGVGEGMARAASEPLRRAVPGADLGQGSGSAGTSAGPAGSGGGSAAPVPPEAELPTDFRPGDIVRLLGFFPSRLREALAALSDHGGRAVIEAIDRLFAGLARDLRRVAHVLSDIERRTFDGIDSVLARLGPAQGRAQIAIVAHFGGASMSLELTSVGRASPGEMHAALQASVRDTALRTASLRGSLSGETAALLERAAGALEQSSLARIASDLDGFLAALDPEPIAAEFDAMLADLLQKAPALLASAADQLVRAGQRFDAIIQDLNPGRQVDKLLEVLNVVRDQLDLFNPTKLAAELAEIHEAGRNAIAAYDPALFAQEIRSTLQAIAAAIRALDPATLLGDLEFLDRLADRVQHAVPSDALRDVGAGLHEVGENLAAIDPGELLEAIESLGPRVLDELEHVVDGIRNEIVALLDAIRYATSNASASGSASVHVG